MNPARPFSSLKSGCLIYTNEEKAHREKQFFLDFLNRAGWPASMERVECRSPPQPDILYAHPTEGLIAFELTEICSPDIAQAITKRSDQAIWTSDPSEKALEKLTKSYRTPYPIDLLCYTDGKVISPDDFIIAKLTPLFASQTKFQRIWLLGDDWHRLYPTV